jgi:isopentenyl diphosphate isomerase/L-lactate dehydrogenase-like FMN-dependent dehydrogenase
MTTHIPLLTVSDYEARARETMPRVLFDRLFGTYGAPDWITNTNNVAAFDAIKLRPRVLADVSHRDLSTKVLGQQIGFPVMLAPTGTHQRAHPEGELASARAAGATGTIMALSTASSYSIEEVADVAAGPLWFQLYFFKDRELTEILVRRAQKAGYKALLLTVDNLGARSRERENRYAYTLQSERILKNFVGIELPNLPTRDNFGESFESALNWSDLAWLRSITSMPLVIKGIQTAEDARLCSEYGAEGLIVSNHGGHALQGTKGTVEMLPEVVEEVGDRLEVFLDGGIRRGTDVLKALALGAKAVFIGRAIFWGLSVDGEAGVRRVLEILRAELDVAMGLCGARDVKKVDRSLVIEPNGDRGGDGAVGQLERLARLLEQGYLTRQEFEAQKAQLLAR